jgi:hypothetical protein
MPYHLSDDALAALRAVFGGEALVFVVVPQGAPGTSVAESSSPTSFAPDLSIEDYRARHEPDLSLSRIRELCVAGAFPDTTDGQDTVTPGAYKNAKGEWRITQAGIVERQRQERLDGMRRRDREAEERKARREAENSAASSSGADEPALPGEVQRPDPQLRAGDAQSVDRPRKGAWREVLGEKVNA